MRKRELAQWNKETAQVLKTFCAFYPHIDKNTSNNTQDAPIWYLIVRFFIILRLIKKIHSENSGKPNNVLYHLPEEHSSPVAQLQVCSSLYCCMRLNGPLDAAGKHFGLLYALVISSMGTAAGSLRRRRKIMLSYSVSSAQAQRHKQRLSCVFLFLTV